nr:hypothetical protein CFP56_40240 [Quercus suber]
MFHKRQREGEKKKGESCDQTFIPQGCYQIRDFRYGDRDRRNSVANIIGTEQRPTKGHKRMPLQMLQKRQKGTKQIPSKKKKM